EIFHSLQSLRKDVASAIGLKMVQTSPVTMGAAGPTSFFSIDDDDEVEVEDDDETETGASASTPPSGEETRERPAST
ncbi:hypothetical protein THAOC_23199, partial [Thalassiosira oceanica]